MNKKSPSPSSLQRICHQKLIKIKYLNQEKRGSKTWRRLQKKRKSHFDSWNGDIFSGVIWYLKRPQANECNVWSRNNSLMFFSKVSTKTRLPQLWFYNMFMKNNTDKPHRWTIFLQTAPSSRWQILEALCKFGFELLFAKRSFTTFTHLCYSCKYFRLFNVN